MAQIRVTPSGILDKDGELSYISNGNYVDGNDIRHRQVDGNNFGGIMSTEGNKNPISLVNGSSSSILPAISTSTKKYRIYLDYSKVASGATTTMSGTLYLENSTGSVFSQVVSLTPSSFSNFAQSMQSQFDTLHLTAFGSGSFTKVPSGAPYYTSTGTNTGYFTLETSSDTDYVLKVKNGNSEIPLCRIVLETEYIATSTTLRPIGSYQFENYLFVWSASETVTTGVTSAVSEIGIIYSTTQGESYQYKTLVRSRKLGFSKERRIEAQIEKVGNQINLYWTDGNAKPRAMYLKYNLATTQNGFMFWEGGRYELETIDDESSYFYKVPSAYFTNIEVLNTGGTLTSGNKRYTGRFLTEDFVATEFLYPTNPINIYLADTKEPYKIHGDDSTVVTTKSVKLTLTNFPKGIYKYFELVSIEYVDNSYFATIVQRYTIDDNVTELEVIHTKNGQDNIPLGANELVAIYSRYLTVENLRIFDSRMVLSNLIEQVDLDLSTWAQNITHSLEYKTIDPVGNVVEDAHDFLASSILSDSPSPAMNGLKYGLEEYLDPKNVLDNTSYVFNDTYRFGIQVKWKSTGKWSAPYYVDDIRFDSLSYNINSGDTRRTANNITSNLTDINGNPCVYYVKFGGIDLDFSVGGKPIRDLIDGFRFVRAERIPEVLATGYFFLGQIDTDGKAIPFKVGQSSTTTTYSFAPTDVVTSTTINKGSAHGFFENQPVFYTEGSGTINNLVDGHYYFVNVISANEFALRVTPGGSLLTLTPVTGTTADFAFSSGYAPSTHSISPSNGSNVLFFHSPDNYYLDRVYDFDTTKHSIKILGPSKQNINITTHGTSGTGPIGCYADLSGYFSSAKRQYLTLSSSTTPAVTDYAILELNQDKSLPGASRTANNKLNIINDVFGLSTPLRYSGGSYFSGGLANNENNGIYYGQIYIDLGSDKKYPVNVENTLYHNIGHYYYLTAGQSGLLGNISVFGGDSYIQKTHLPISIREGNIGGTMIGCYSQNVVNTQMFSVIEDDNSTSGAGFKWPEYPNTDAVTHYIRPSYFSGVINAVGKIWDSLSDFLSSTKIPQRSYNASYNYNDDTIIEQGFI
jgi:hypothetical protein